MNFIASPELIIALALGGSLSFNPLKDSLKTSSNELKVNSLMQIFILFLF